MAKMPEKMSLGVIYSGHNSCPFLGAVIDMVLFIGVCLLVAAALGY